MKSLKYYKLDSDDVLEIVLEYLHKQHKDYNCMKGKLFSYNEEVRFVGVIGKEEDEEEILSTNLEFIDEKMDYNGEHAFIRNNPQYNIKSEEI